MTDMYAQTQTKVTAEMSIKGGWWYLLGDGLQDEIQRLLFLQRRTQPEQMDRRITSKCRGRMRKAEHCPDKLRGAIILH